MLYLSNHGLQKCSSINNFKNDNGANITFVLERILLEMTTKQNQIEKIFNPSQELNFNFSHHNKDEISSTDQQDYTKCGNYKCPIIEDINQKMNNKIENQNHQALFCNDQNPLPNELDLSILPDTFLSNQNNNDIQLNDSQTLQNDPVYQEDSHVNALINSILKGHSIGFFFFICGLLYLKFNLSYYYAIILLWSYDIYNISINTNTLIENNIE